MRHLALLTVASALVLPSALLAQEGDDATGLQTEEGYADLPTSGPSALARPEDPEVRADADPLDVGETEAPLPTERPDGGEAPVTAVPGDSPDPSDLPPVYRRLAESDAEFEACTARLQKLGATFEPVAPVTTAKDSDCGIARPLSVTQIVPGVALRPDAVMRCETAVALAEWTAESVVPEAKNLPGGGELAAINHGSTYICRRRNNRPTGKLSEHSFGNAVDVMGFEFTEGDPLRIEPREPEASPEGRFQRAVRKASCEHFTTVLGPGSNAAHADHLHLDVKQRRGGYRLCE